MINPFSDQTLLDFDLDSFEDGLLVSADQII